MSSDGCQVPTWTGKAFPYLLHHSGTLNDKVTTVAVERDQGAGTRGESKKAAGTGTWDGPAPKGNQGMSSSCTATAAVSASRDARHVVLPGAACLPLLGFCTQGASQVDVRCAVDCGFRHFESCPAYSNEDVVGAALQDGITRFGRDQFFIASKIFTDAGSPEAVRASCTKSIHELQCSYLDLLLLQRQESLLPDTEDVDVWSTVPQTWQAMDQLVDEGLVKAIGVADFNLTEIEQLLNSCRVKPVVHQVELHPLLAQRKLVGVCFRKGVVSVSHCPLAGNLDDLMKHSTVVEVAKQCGKTAAQVVLRWSIQRGVPVLLRQKDMESNEWGKSTDDLFDWSLSYEQKAALDKLDCDVRAVASA